MSAGGPPTRAGEDILSLLARLHRRAFNGAMTTEHVIQEPHGVGPPAQLTEVPLSEKTSYSVAVGMDVRMRPEDPAFMPGLSVGIVTGL